MGGGEKEMKRKVRKWSSFLWDNTGGGGKEMKGRDFGGGWSFLGPTDQEIGNIKSCESKNVGQDWE